MVCVVSKMFEGKAPSNNTSGAKTCAADAANPVYSALPAGSTTGAKTCALPATVPAVIVNVSEGAWTIEPAAIVGALREKPSVGVVTVAVLTINGDAIETAPALSSGA